MESMWLKMIGSYMVKVNTDGDTGLRMIDIMWDKMDGRSGVRLMEVLKMDGCSVG